MLVAKGETSLTLLKIAPREKCLGELSLKMQNVELLYLLVKMYVETYC